MFDFLFWNCFEIVPNFEKVVLLLDLFSVCFDSELRMARLSQEEVDKVFLEEIPDHQGKKTIFLELSFSRSYKKTMSRYIIN
jgi:hypothetical protein